MQQYLDLLRDVLKHGRGKDDRTGTGTISTFGSRMEFDLSEGFPLITTRKMFTKAFIHETLWFMRGSTNAKELQAKGVHIWDEWAAIKEMVEVGENIDRRKLVDALDPLPTIPDFDDLEWSAVQDWFKRNGLNVEDYLYVKEGEIGPLYGKQMRAWPGAFGPIDQVMQALDTLREDPTSRRICISCWNVDSLPWRGHSIEENVMEGRMALAPCHAFYQFYAEKLSACERLKSIGRYYTATFVEANEARFLQELKEANVPEYQLSCQLYQRSVDSCCGLPFNIASYALLTHMFCHILNFVPGKFIHVGGDVHIYKNHIENVMVQLERQPRKLPTLRIDTKGRRVTDPAFFQFEDFILEGYDPHPALKYEVSK